MARAMGGVSISLRRPFPLQRLVEAPPVGDAERDIVWRFPGDRPCLAGSRFRGCHQPAAGEPDLMTSAIFPGSCGSPRDYAVYKLKFADGRKVVAALHTQTRASAWRRKWMQVRAGLQVESQRPQLLDRRAVGHNLVERLRYCPEAVESGELFLSPRGRRLSQPQSKRAVPKQTMQQVIVQLIPL